MPMRNGVTREIDVITVDEALKEIRRYREQYPDSPPEVAAMGLMRQVDDWDEHKAILKACKTVLAEIAKAHESDE